ncbi:hypothetical protein L3V31_03470 [Vibrio sp. J1-1]|uniref:hypothetical protein n=1 Tax=Vibrio sp. J1-1 TaxID=2912251 RepID=UPI001F40C611|nr:hypothetical protein [Vibrio sp. J1-1]MCF7480800.1 hypothetical protein [Vibrio sp. J1-1]
MQVLARFERTNGGIVLRPLSYYEHPSYQYRDWNGVVLGYGNVALKDIDPLIQRLSELF